MNSDHYKGNAPSLDLSDPESRYHLIAESSRDVVWIMDLSMRTIYVSPSVFYQLGYTPQEYLMMPEADRFPPDSVSTLRNIQDELFADLAAGRKDKAGAWRSFEILYRHKNGCLIWEEVSFSVFFDAEGVPQGIHGITRDIEERKLWERALRESEERYRTLVEMLPIGVFECDLSGRIGYANDALYRMCGYERDQAPIDLYIPRLMIPEDWPRIRRNMARLLAGETVLDNCYRALRKDGSHFPIEVHSSVLEVEGSSVGFRGVIIDVSSKKRYEDEILRNNKLEAVGLLAGGIAHDFNNILAAVMGNINLAVLEAEGNDHVVALLSEAEKAILRARGLTQQLLTFSRGGAPVRETTSVEGAVREVAEFNTAGSSSRCKILIENDLPLVCVDRDQFGQVIQNLVINAVQAMPSGGLITIRLARQRNGAEGDGEPRDWLKLEVEDEGPGVPSSIRDRIFDPYFTTKKTGTGLGLAVSFSIVKNHGGEITVGESAAGGALFTVLLPAVKEPPPEIGASVVNRPRRNLRLLFVDDEAALRDLAFEMAPRAGYRLKAVAGAEEAIDLWEDARRVGEPFDLVIVDLTLRGGMGGLDLFTILRERDPEVLVLASSGYSDDPVLSAWRERGFAGILKKPYNLSDFIETVERAFDRLVPAGSCQG